MKGNCCPIFCFSFEILSVSFSRGKQCSALRMHYVVYNGVAHNARKCGRASCLPAVRAKRECRELSPGAASLEEYTFPVVPYA